MSSPPIEWSHFGWQGLQFDVPATWNLAVVNGEYESGYLRLDDDEMVRLELKWEGRRNRLPIDRVATNYLKALEKQAHKRKLPFEYKRDLKFATMPDHDYECLSWASDFNALSVVSRCHDCGRVVLARVLYRKGDGGKAMARRLFSSLRDHPEDEKVLWQFFDFRFASPKGFVLERTALKTGAIEMYFYDKKDEFEVCRIALAQILLKRDSLQDWFSEYYRKRLKGFIYDVDKASYRGHPGLLCTGRTSVRKSLFAGLQRRRYLKVRVWHCEEIDKIHLVRFVSSDEEDERFDAFCAEVMPGVKGPS